MKNSLPCSFWCKCSIDCSNKSLLFDDSKEADILFFDLETTGLSSDAKIIELSFFYPATEVWYSSLVQQHNVSNFILELTGITQKELSTANSWNIVSTELCQWLLSLSSKKYLFLLGHNATSYDENILSKQLDIVKQKLPENCFFEDTIRIFKKMVPKKYNGSFNLESLSKEFLNEVVQHRANKDVEVLWKLFKKLTPTGYNTIYILENICLQHIKKMIQPLKKERKLDFIQLFNWNQNSCFLDTFCVIWQYCIHKNFLKNMESFSKNMNGLNKVLEMLDKGFFIEAQKNMWNLAINIAKELKVGTPKKIGDYGTIYDLFDGFVISQTERAYFSLKWILKKHCNFCQNTIFNEIQQLGLTLLTRENNNDFNNLEKAFQQKLHSLTSEPSICICGKTMLQSLISVELPNCLIVEYPRIDSKNTNYIVNLQERIKLNGNVYCLNGVIYWNGNHYWCEFFLGKSGWFFYNDMKNFGRAKYVGLNPQFKTPEYLSILIYNLKSNWESSQSEKIKGSQ